MELKYTLNCTYKNNELILSTLKIFVNGKIHTTNKIQKTGNSYTITTNGNTSEYLNPILYSGALLYFNEPKKHKKIYSEFNNIEKDIKNIEINEYEITNPENGLKNEYVYSDGFLNSSTIHHKLLNFTITKK